MKQIIPFVKDISLNSKIEEITSIALEHNLKMENNDSIVGVFTISGKYKINEISSWTIICITKSQKQELKLL